MIRSLNKMCKAQIAGVVAKFCDQFALNCANAIANMIIDPEAKGKMRTMMSLYRKAQARRCYTCAGTTAIMRKLYLRLHRLIGGAFLIECLARKTHLSIRNATAIEHGLGNSVANRTIVLIV